MIGTRQNKLLDNIRKYKYKNILLVGDIYSGRKTLLTEYANSINVSNIITLPFNDINTIRELEYNNITNAMYIFDNIDKWHISAYSVLLKQLEENAFNIYGITATTLQNIPDSILSRCKVYNMPQYYTNELPNKYCSNIGIAKLYEDNMLKVAIYIIDSIVTNTFNIHNSMLELSYINNLYVFYHIFLNILYSRINQDDRGDTLCIYNKIYYTTIQSVTEVHLDIQKELSNKDLFILNWLSRLERIK